MDGQSTDSPLGRKALGLEFSLEGRDVHSAALRRRTRATKWAPTLRALVASFWPGRNTVLEFVLTNSRLTPDELAQARKNTSFSMNDFTYARILFGKGQIDVACLWEPDVTLALASRPGAHRLFSTADAPELVADTLVAHKEFLDLYPDLAVKLARVWFAGVKKAEADRPGAARLIATVCSRFRDELGYEATLKAFNWVKWTDLADNVRMFGLDGQPPVFDRVYAQADGIWINYPQAEIKDRFAPATLLNQQVVPQVQMAGGMYVRVEGNTDNLGDESWNQGLSERRAQAIVDYLVSRGVDRRRMLARGNGSSKPLGSNKTPEGRARNRRTDVMFIPAGA